MRSTFLALVVTIALAGVAAAEDKAADKPAAPASEKPAPAAAKGKPVTLSGTMVCGKCTLNETAKCQNVLKVTRAGKGTGKEAEVKYYLAENDVAEKGHEEVCSGEHKATVKGTVAEEGGKKILTASSIKYK
jgi:hypothetical protein